MQQLHLQPLLHDKQCINGGVAFQLEQMEGADEIKFQEICKILLIYN